MELHDAVTSGVALFLFGFVLGIWLSPKIIGFK